jgi:hypothetical protein
MENSRGQNQQQQRSNSSMGQQQQNMSSDQQRERLSSGEGFGEQQQNVSSGRESTSGSTNDIDRNQRSSSQGRTASGVSTKRNITGSDYDGQVAPE